MSIVASCPSEQLACDRHVSRVGSFDIIISSFSFSISIRHWVSLEFFIMSRFLVLCFLSSTCWANLASGGAVPSSRQAIVPAKRPTAGLRSRQVPGGTTSDAFVRRAWQASAVAGKFLYIDGGEISYMIGDSVVNQYASATLSIDLSQDWVNSSVVFNSTNKPSGAPLLSDSSLWYDTDQDVF
ncbi:hypothetical protein XANCAGTX0491_009834 [Xanthoria calcicola]